MRPGLLVHAARAARGRQLRARALRPLRRRRFPQSQPPPLDPPGGAASFWRSPAFEPVALAGEGGERLRAFHAQYGDDVLAAARGGDSATVRAGIESWIARNSPRPGDAWHPYPVSTRVGNWIAALALEPDAATSEIASSLWRQLLHLGRNVEDDVLGNHVIRNARALVLGGAAFGSSALTDRGLSLLARELPEQILPDGGHYERSPVYHLVVLRDLLEVEAVLPGSVPARVLDGMSAFATALARPDGAPALFNDGSVDLAPRLGLPLAGDGLAVFPETGYAVVRRDGIWLAFDCGAPAPPFLPAHAHADALSFQLWADGRPLVVDPGMPTYEPGAERDWYRGTRAHSTVAVDGDQFEVWGAFRSGPLPRVELLGASERELAASVVGKTGVRHTRRIAIERDAVVVSDTLEGPGRHSVESSLPLPPGAEVAARPERGRLVHEDRFVAERLYERVPATALVVREEPVLPVRTGWTIPVR